jgi:hypothetical protein
LKHRDAATGMIILRHYRAKALLVIEREPAGMIPKDALLNMIL